MSILTEIMGGREQSDIEAMREGWETIQHAKRGLARVTDISRDGTVRRWRVVAPGIAAVATFHTDGEVTECRRAFPTN